MKKIRYILIIQVILLFLGCDNECEIISRKYDNGNKRFVDVYPNCNNKSEFKRYIYFENGKLQNEGAFVNNKEHGTFKRWNRKGILVEKWDLANGKTTGKTECWYENGVKKREFYSIDGKDNGEFKEWDENGKLTANGFYENGKKSGKWIFMYGDGSKFERIYNKDTLTGKTYEYIVDSSKIIHVNGQYLNGVETGQWKWFNEDSILYQTAIYKEGKITEIKEVENNKK